jgi:hypothetical protein
MDVLERLSRDGRPGPAAAIVGRMHRGFRASEAQMSTMFQGTGACRLGCGGLKAIATLAILPRRLSAVRYARFVVLMSRASLVLRVMITPVAKLIRETAQSKVSGLRLLSSRRDAQSDGQITWANLSSPLSSPFGKNILIFRKRKSVLYIRRPAPNGGAFRDRHRRGAGCGGRGGAFDEQRQCGRRSRVVLTPRRWRQVGS